MLFDQRVCLMEIRESSPGIFGWCEAKRLWARTEETGKTNLFSKVGIGAKTTLFTLPRVSGIDLHRALSWRGHHYFLSGIQCNEPLLMTLTASRIEPILCTAFRTRTEKDDCKRIVRLPDEEIARFPACLTEKYLGFKQEAPMARTETSLVLVVPKQVWLESGDLVDAGGVRYAVQLRHTLDGYKNEYEINRKADV